VRGLTAAEENALLIILSFSNGHPSCGFCWEMNAGHPPDFSVDESIVARLIGRGLVVLLPCNDVFGDLHAIITPQGRYVLALVRMARAA
jgi:hypothetical protein